MAEAETPSYAVRVAPVIDENAPYFAEWGADLHRIAAFPANTQALYDLGLSEETGVYGGSQGASVDALAASARTAQADSSQRNYVILWQSYSPEALTERGVTKEKAQAVGLAAIHTNVELTPDRGLWRRIMGRLVPDEDRYTRITAWGIL